MPPCVCMRFYTCVCLHASHCSVCVCKRKKNCACSSVVVKIPSVCLNQMCVGGVCGEKGNALLSFKLVSVSSQRNHQRYSRPSSWLSSPYLHGPIFNRPTKTVGNTSLSVPWNPAYLFYVNIYIEFPLIFCVYLISQVPNPPFHQRSGIVYN